MIWGAMTSAGVGPLCFNKSNVNAAIYQKILEHFMVPSADKLYGDADFLSRQTLASAHNTKTTSKCFADHDITGLDWQANMPDLNPIWNLWDIFKRKMIQQSIQQYRRAEDTIVPQQSHRLIASIPHLTAEFELKEL